MFFCHMCDCDSSYYAKFFHHCIFPWILPSGELKIRQNMVENPLIFLFCLFCIGGHVFLVFGRFIHRLFVCFVIHHGLQIYSPEEKTRRHGSLYRSPNSAKNPKIYLQTRHV